MATTCVNPVLLSKLFSAAFGGDLDTVKQLLAKHQISPDATDPNTGSTVLMWAASGGHLEAVKWLVKVGGANTSHHNKDKRTALFFACEFCHKPVAEFLVGQRGVNVNDQDNSSGHSALHRLCIAGQTREAKAAEAKAIISWLITECDADVNAVDLAGRLPGEADLSSEAPNLQPTTLAIEIKEMLEDARQGRFPRTPKTATDADGPMSKPRSEPVACTGGPNPQLVAESPASSSRPNSANAFHGVNVSALVAAYEERCRQASI